MLHHAEISMRAQKGTEGHLLLLTIQLAVLPQLSLVDMEERLLRPDHAAWPANPDVRDGLQMCRLW